MNNLRANTLSICAVDLATGEAGVAVASRCLAAGGIVPFAAVGVGAIATQAVADMSFGPRGLELLKAGKSAAETVNQLISRDETGTAADAKWIEYYRGEQLSDEGVDFSKEPDGRIRWFTRRIRQLGIVDAQGRAAVHSGARIFPWFGSRTGPGFCCQGNMLAGPQVVDAMYETFERRRSSGAPLVRGLFDALAAGEAAGGDKRGKQAAGILVVKPGAHWMNSERWCDLRVDDHAEPVKELERILKKGGYLD